MDQDEKKKEELLEEIEKAIKKYRRNRKVNGGIQWTVLLLVTIAGFLTAAAGAAEGNPAWFATPGWLTAWGLIAAIGSLIIQNAKPAEKAENYEKKKDAMRAIRTAIKYRDLNIKEAADLVELTRSDPAQAFDDMANRLKVNQSA